MKSRLKTSTGFTLTELAIVLIIVSLMVSGILLTMSTSRDIAAATETEKHLATISDALLGFAAANKRLPCPATDASNGQELFCESAVTCAAPITPQQVPAVVNHGRCATFSGLLPGAALGITPTNAQGQAIDSWSNPIRYAVSSDPNSAAMNSNAAPNPQRYSFTKLDGMKETTLAALHPDLHVCSTGAATATFQCTATTLTDVGVAVILSNGKNGVTPVPATRPDEFQNSAGSSDRVFTRHNFSEDDSGTAATNEYFDDIVVWLSPNVLYNRLITAGTLQ